jgi:hypothetical protein
MKLNKINSPSGASLRSSMRSACDAAFRFRKQTPAQSLRLIVTEPERRGTPLGKILEDNGYEANRLFELNNRVTIRKRG